MSCGGTKRGNANAAAISDCVQRINADAAAWQQESRESGSMTGARHTSASDAISAYKDFDGNNVDYVFATAKSFGYSDEDADEFVMSIVGAIEDANDMQAIGLAGRDWDDTPQMTEIESQLSDMGMDSETATALTKEMMARPDKAPKRPTVVRKDGTKEWTVDGRRHRDNDQPAIMYPDGSKEWAQNDVYHRDGDQPAIIKSDGTRSWWYKGKLHRDDGKPAIIEADGTPHWFVHGVRTNPDGTPLED